MSKDKLKREFEFKYKIAGLPPVVAEYRFAPPRKWKFDYSYPDRKIAIELEGGVFSGGRHTRPMGFIGDCEKYNTAACLGWRLLRFTVVDLRNGTFLTFIERILEAGNV